MITHVEGNRDEHKNVARANAGSRAARRGGSLDEHLDAEHDLVHLGRGRRVRVQTTYTVTFIDVEYAR